MGAKHGGNLRALAAQVGRDREQILDFSASVNPLGPPDGLRAVLARSIDELVHYPDPECAELAAAIARRYDVPVEQIVVGNGSSELLFAVARACEFRRAVAPVPCYVDYITAVEAVGRNVQFVPLSPDADFAIDWETLGAAISPGDLILLGQPNNPTGRTFDADAFLAFADSRPSVTFVVDEAFADFVEGYRSLVGRAPGNVIVLRSLTKFYAIAGLRLGFLAASATIVERAKRQIAPWSVNTLAQAAGVAVLADEDYARRTVVLVGEERQWLASQLAAIAGLHVFPSQANYLLLRLDGEACDARALADRLLSDGLAIRTFGAGQHLDDRYFRVAVRTREENQRLCEALARALGAGTAVANLRQSPGESRQLHSPKKTPAIMFQGTSSNAGKSVLTAALCRVLLQDGLRVVPFKSQNMSLNSFVTADGREMGRAQVVQAQACRVEPDVRMNPILLKPNSDTGCQVIVCGKPVGNMRVGEYIAYKPQAFEAAQECYDSLAGQFDTVVLEGAGSPGEVNLKSHDIVNMRMAQYAGAPVLVVGDIDRGGVFASFVGTMEVLAPWERRLVAGWLVNRFRGDPSLLGAALDYTREHTGRPVLGVVPFLPNLGLPQEDSVEFKSGAMERASREAAVEIALIDLPHISNFTDFDAFGVESDVRLRTIRSADELDHPDAVILPGSKNTLGDLEYLRRSGLAERIAGLADEKSTEIVGICGGLQMLGAEIRDPLAIESSAQSSPGLGLLDVCTVMSAEKTLQRTVARHAPSGLDVTGYEIHHGQTSAGAAQAVLTRPDGVAAGLASPDHRVWGTYLHGVFDADPFRRWFVDRLRVRRGLPPLGKVTACYDIEPALDRLADVFRRSVRVDEIYRLMGL